MVLHVPLDFFMLVFAGMSAYALRFSDWATMLKPVVFRITLTQFVSLTSWVALGWLIIFALTGLYSTDPNRKFSRDIARVFLACSTGLAAVAVYVLFTQQLFDSRFLVVASWAFAILYITGGRLFMRGVKALLYRMDIGLRRVVIIGHDTIAHQIIETFKKRKELGYNVVGTFDHFSDGAAAKLNKLFIDELLFTNPRAEEDETFAALNYCDFHHIAFKYSADLFATYSVNMRVYPLLGVPIVELKRTPLEGWGRVIKRMSDIVGAIIMIILTSPLMLLSAMGILMETGFPIIYKNERVGLRGKQFFTLKFRSMYQKDSTGSQFGAAGRRAEERERALIEDQNVRKGPIYKIGNDPRVTPFGRWIRRWSLDELPQFFNVLGGSMSMVGPRPHQPREVSAYEKQHPKVFTLKPGVTGLAQISGRSDLPFEEEVRLDIFYIEKWNVLLDAIIFLKTPFVLFKKRRAL